MPPVPSATIPAGRRARILRLAAGVCSVITAAGFAQNPAGPKADDSAAEVRSIFARSCYQCHGPQAQLAGLRLDVKASGMRVIQAGRPEASDLYQRIMGQGDQPRMPM